AESLLICGQVDGPAHITGVSCSVIVISCRQFRMHDCTNVDVYLSCSSRPIIEGCRNIRFGKFPVPYARQVCHFFTIHSSTNSAWLSFFPSTPTHVSFFSQWV